MRKSPFQIILGAWLLAVPVFLMGQPHSSAKSGQSGKSGVNNRENSARVYDLRCEYLPTPLGVDNSHPALSWKLKQQDTTGGSALKNNSADIYYRIIVGKDADVVARAAPSSSDTSIVWNSGFRLYESPFVRYQGTALSPLTRYYWKIVSTTDTGSAASSIQDAAMSYFETGLGSVYNWKGAWISDNHPISFKPAGYFRKEFALHKQIKSARIYIAAAGLYRLSLNGEKVGDRELDPVYTRFDRRLYYTTYDVTASLKSGLNALGVVLGNGWYNLQSTAVWDFDKAPWRSRPCFVLDLIITYSDGSVQTICTGKDWKTRTGKITFNSIYTAEHQDNRLTLDGWDQPHPEQDDWHKKQDTLWQDVIYRSAPTLHISSAVMVPIRKSAAITGVTMQKFSDTDYVFNIHQNIAGISEIRVKGEAGTVLRLRHGERLYKDGHVDQSNIDVHYRPTDDSDPFQTDIYTLSGKAEEVFRPWFGYKGFQYVEVTSSRPVTLSDNSLQAYFMHSDVSPAGKIHSSDTILNKIWAATNQSYLSNLMGYPTDCPQREKNGWTGDGQINIETGLYNFDGITVYKKWMQDHLDEQQPNGVLPSIVPTDGWGYEWGNGPDWTSTIAVIPWNLYLFYGDDQVLRDCYEGIKRYVDYTTGISETGICSWGLGDWVPVKSRTPVPFTSTIYYYTDVRILAQAARLFGKTADYQRYTALAEKIKKVFNDTYLDKQTGIYDKGYQTEMSAPLYWGIVPEEMASKVAAQLNQRVIADGYKLDVGLLGSKTILDALSKYGYHNTAYQMAATRSFPSWGWWMVNGATTLYENWNIQSKNDISLNHIMFGQIGAWMYSGLAGILPDPASPGFKHSILRPALPDSLTRFEAEHQTPYGTVSIAWKRTPSGKKSKGQYSLVHMTVKVPMGTTASFMVPEGYAPETKLPSLTFVPVTVESSPGYPEEKAALQDLKEGALKAELGPGSYTFVLQKRMN
ncbi:alpha-L-rhamnosidase [Arachidicoccus rhizosphaerae]|uniref:alpha-L-rhamnosidase n=1 Tax=Arachidicoccus rhizosphaerae TaxID=551991 RepID=A0A1H3VMV1_9BACT|nr:alpha-L-rhamnosidase [Arachidicoccus rhizosphaerae]SDZ76031.1 alpha-L-rhamnosidase [Arachidicoccus rhizosphaerae]